MIQWFFGWNNVLANVQNLQKNMFSDVPVGRCTNGRIGPTQDRPRITSFSLVVESELSIELA